MAQARRKRSTKLNRGFFITNRPNISMLAIGMVIGSLATVLWQGVNTETSIGAGIRQMSANLRQPDTEEVESKPPAKLSQEQPAKSSTDYTFYTVLPEIEVDARTPETAVVEIDTSKTEAERESQTGSEGETKKVAQAQYMVQIGSYSDSADADQMKAILALNGVVSIIQKVSIEDRGDFYRVRTGPYPTYQAMQKAIDQLQQYGVKNPLRLKLHKSG